MGRVQHSGNGRQVASEGFCTLASAAAPVRGLYTLEGMPCLQAKWQRAFRGLGWPALEVHDLQAIIAQSCQTCKVLMQTCIWRSYISRRPRLYGNRWRQEISPAVALWS